MIELKDLQCSFSQRVIIEKFSLKIDRHLSILGANGSGKSTLAQAICGSDTFSGEVLIEHQNIESLSLKQRAKLISYIPAKLEIYDTFISVKEFVLLGRYPYKEQLHNYSDEDNALAYKSLEMLNISHLCDARVSTLSSGEQQLLLIAQALTQQSKIIIFDEPTANLDPLNSKIIAKHIQNLKTNHQIILITHDLHLASFINTPVLFLHKQQADYYAKDFFQQKLLSSLYGVKFNGLVVDYD